MCHSNQGPSILALAILLALTGAPGYAHAAPQEGPSAPQPDRAARVPMPVTHCGQELTVPGDYRLVSDLGPCYYGVSIVASNVRLDLAGFTISGQDCADFMAGIWIDPEASNVWVAGGTVKGFFFGVALQGSNSRLHGVTVTDSCLGVGVSGRGNTVDTSMITRSEIVGLVADEESQGFTARSNYIFGNGDGVFVEGADATLQDNIVNDNAGAGISLASLDGTVQDNVATGNTFGIFVTGSRISLIGNTVNTNTVGIALRPGSTAIRVVRNSAWSNREVDLSDANPACHAHRWRRNRFGTDVIGLAPDGGPGTGCIQ